MTDDPLPGRWDFGLEAGQEARAARLHAECIVFDGMNQHPGGAAIFGQLPPEALAGLGEAPGFEGLGRAMFLPYKCAAEGTSDVIRDWWKQSGVDVGTAGAPVHPAMAKLPFYEEARRLLDSLDWIRPVTTAREIRENKARGIVSMWAYDQPVFGIPNNIAAVEDAYRRGLRTLMLTYNRMDYVGTGCTERYDAGLSMYGLDVVKKCNQLGIIVDTSHCGKRTTLDACAFSEAPVIANHAAAKGCHPHARGKSDEELEAIAASGGLVGIVVVPPFLTDAPDASVEHMLDHIDYIARKVGWQHVGLGTDWPMQAPLDLLQKTLGSMVGEIGFRPQDNISTNMALRGFGDGRDFPNITRGLVSRGYSDEQIAGILGENYLRVIERVCG